MQVSDINLSAFLKTISNTGVLIINVKRDRFAFQSITGMSYSYIKRSVKTQFVLYIKQYGLYKIKVTRV